MKAIVMFDRDKLEWHLVQLNLHGSFVKSLSTINRCLTNVGRVKFPHVLEVNIDSFEVNGENSYLWSSSELPKTPSIHDCIAKNKADILLALNKLTPK